MLKSASKVTINTGNVLNLIDVKKKAGQNVTEELSESIKLTLSEWSSNIKPIISNGTATRSSDVTDYIVDSTSTPRQMMNITRPHDDVQNRMAEEERKNLKVGVKIFINEDSTAAITECLENVFAALHTDHIDNVILAYNPDIPHKDTPELVDDKGSTKVSPISLGSIGFQRRVPQGVVTPESGYKGATTSRVEVDILNLGRVSSTDPEPDTDLDKRKCETLLPGIKTLWSVLEDYVKNGRVYQLGVADVGSGCLRRLHAWSLVHPTIAQINLASCCVVPPSLHSFCKANDVQLLTHADPPDLLSTAAIKTLGDVGISCKNLDWCARYQVHIKCRGVLALKGYVCKATLCDQVDSE